MVSGSRTDTEMRRPLLCTPARTVTRAPVNARWPSIVLAVALCLMTSCRSGTPDPLDTLPLHTASTEELVTLLNQRSEHIHTLRALLQLQAWGRIIPIRRSMAMSLSYVRPSLIRLRAFDPLGSTLFDMTSDQTHFHVQLPTQNRIVTGTHPAESGAAHSNTTSIRTRMLHFVRAVSATVLVSPIDATHRVTSHKEGALYRIEVAPHSQPDQPTRKLWVERVNLDVVKEAVFGDTGNPIILVEFDDYRTLGSPGNAQYPFLMSIHDIAMDSRYTLTFQEVLLNPTLPPMEFDALES